MLKKVGIPLLFVFLWSTGFVGAKMGLPSAEPFTFLAIRMVLAVVLIAMLIPFLKPQWPSRLLPYIHFSVVGVLVHGMYLGGVFVAIYQGMPSAIAAIIVGLQPIMTSILATLWLKESLTTVKVFGLLLGFAGVALVVSNQLADVSSISLLPLIFTASSLLCISVGTIYQKRYCSQYDLLSSVFVQYIANLFFMLCLAFVFESREIHWTGSFVFALGWLVVVLSLGAVLLLMWLIRHGEAGSVASLFYLVPPFTAIEAWLLFGESFSGVGIIGLCLCVAGVALVVTKSR